MKNNQFTTEEKVLQILNNKYSEGNTNSIYVYKSDFSSLDITESEITRSIYLLQTDGMISIVKASPKHDLSMPWTISLKSAGVHYFEHKNQKVKANRREWIRTYLPVTISFIALVKSFSHQIISLWQLIMQALK